MVTMMLKMIYLLQVSVYCLLGALEAALSSKVEQEPSRPTGNGLGVNVEERRPRGNEVHNVWCNNKETAKTKSGGL